MCCNAAFGGGTVNDGHIDPEDSGRRAAFVAPAVGACAQQIERVAGAQVVLFVLVDPEGEFAGDNVDEFFTWMSIGFLAATARLDLDALGFQGTRASDE